MDNAIYEGFQIMVLGMGTVFAFLLIMVCAMTVISKVVTAFNERFPEPVAEQASAPVAQQQGSSDEMVAIAVAMANLKK